MVNDIATFAWQPGSQGADTVLASDCRAQFGRPSRRMGGRICATVRLPVRPRGETMYWQANANTPPFRYPLLNVTCFRGDLLRSFELGFSEQFSEKASCSRKYSPAILGLEMSAPISWVPGMFGFLLLEKSPHAHKIPQIGGGGEFFFGRGLFFWGTGIFLKFRDLKRSSEMIRGFESQNVALNFSNFLYSRSPSCSSPVYMRKFAM